jgi:hypothetical protein
VTCPPAFGGREFHIAACGATAAWPLAARAQQPAMLVVVGLLTSLSQTLAMPALQREASIGNQIRLEAMP